MSVSVPHEAIPTQLEGLNASLGVVQFSTQRHNLQVGAVRNSIQRLSCGTDEVWSAYGCRMFSSVCECQDVMHPKCRGQIFDSSCSRMTFGECYAVTLPN